MNGHLNIRHVIIFGDLAFTKLDGLYEFAKLSNVINIAIY